MDQDAGKGEDRLNTVLTVAGSDCSGGAGIQADLKTIGAFGLYGMSVITAITVQNTMGVRRVEPVEPGLVAEQMQAVLEDILPDAVKIGMVVSKENIHALVHIIKKYSEKGKTFPFIVLDPVLVSTSGRVLLEPEAETALKEELFPMADLITPNLPEAEQLCGCPIEKNSVRERAAEELSGRYGCSVLIKGGHGSGADDLLFHAGTGAHSWYAGTRIENSNTHGTGCTLSSAIACGMAQGKTLGEAVADAKVYITGAIGAGLDLGKGNGPLDHFYQRQ